MNQSTARRVFGAGLSLWLCASASAVTVSDNFNDNVLNTAFWRKARVGGVNIVERNSRLEVPASNTGSVSGAFLEVKPWGINWKDNFTLQANYNCSIPQPVGDRAATLAFVLTFEGNLLAGDYSGAWSPASCVIMMASGCIAELRRTASRSKRNAN